MPSAGTNERLGQTFTLGEVLMVLTGRLLCDVNDVYRILNYLTGVSLYTHQLPRATRVVAPYVAEQHPDLADLDWSDVNWADWQGWLNVQIGRFGPTRTLVPLPAGTYESSADPFDE
jgi:hypothetical protein